MPARIRLQRHGKKNQPYYHIVVADGRAPRDGKFIEKLGVYNPMKNPAEITLNIDSAVNWLKNGAQPSETARRILSYKGVLLKRHLQIGVEKGAISQEQADVKFNQWLQEKEAKINSKRNTLESEARDARKARLEAETKANAAKAEAVAAKKAAAAEAEAAAKAAAEAEANAEANAEAEAEQPAEEAPAQE
ncbi:MAG: 30S ribosomal protein S16 [Bacteroidales bacterium]|nr:30S ribosomal protein S16 [Bacteroidales bacterium]MBP5241798.1 30S ribosomal protein S16 [Bacteroidales bacterium]MBP5758703.1 30S ribosomal protein S16 [Bacteroidales bacterium]